MCGYLIYFLNMYVCVCVCLIYFCQQIQVYVRVLRLFHALLTMWVVASLCRVVSRELAWTLARTWVTFRGCVHVQAHASYNAIRRFFPDKTRLDLHRNRISVCLSDEIIQRERANSPYDIRAKWVPRMSRRKRTRSRKKEREQQHIALLIHSGAH